eukprot:TRINITY_DN8620_c0_g1_i1.p2 TRINITY_DN8620_c0_g1~~TRINITY_DN8620_c0_g1_i1.p2  ORF type:complete len:171 (-),score=17.32 TRINITY_DN8620_c0_g1_i1:623-1135(-)
MCTNAFANVPGSTLAWESTRKDRLTMLLSTALPVQTPTFWHTACIICTSIKRSKSAAADVTGTWSHWQADRRTGASLVATVYNLQMSPERTRQPGKNYPWITVIDAAGDPNQLRAEENEVVYWTAELIKMNTYTFSGLLLCNKIAIMQKSTTMVTPAEPLRKAGAHFQTP